MTLSSDRLEVAPEFKMRKQLISEIDQKLMALGNVLRVHPEKAEEILGFNKWLLDFRKELES